MAGRYCRRDDEKVALISQASPGLSKDSAPQLLLTREAALLVFANSGQEGLEQPCLFRVPRPRCLPFPTLPPLGPLQFRASSLVMELEYKPSDGTEHLASRQRGRKTGRSGFASLHRLAPGGTCTSPPGAEGMGLPPAAPGICPQLLLSCLVSKARVAFPG